MGRASKAANQRAIATSPLGVRLGTAHTCRYDSLASTADASMRHSPIAGRPTYGSGPSEHRLSTTPATPFTWEAMSCAALDTRDHRRRRDKSLGFTVGVGGAPGREHRLPVPQYSHRQATGLGVHSLRRVRDLGHRDRRRASGDRRAGGSCGVCRVW